MGMGTCMGVGVTGASMGKMGARRGHRFGYTRGICSQARLSH